MNDLKAPNFIPPWATSLLGGNRKHVAVPSKEAGSHNDNVRTDSAGANPKLSDKQGDRTTNVYQVDSSEAPNDTDGSDEVDDNNDDDDEDGLRNLPRSLSLETEHIDSDAARPQSSSSRAEEKHPSFRYDLVWILMQVAASSSKRKRSLPTAEARFTGYKGRQTEMMHGNDSVRSNHSAQTSRSREDPGTSEVERSKGTGDILIPAFAASHQTTEMTEHRPLGSGSRPHIIKIDRKRPRATSSEGNWSDYRQKTKGFRDRSYLMDEDTAFDETTQFEHSTFAHDTVDQDLRIGGPAKNIIQTAAGRPYTEWPQPDGTTRIHNGGICPTNYQLWNDPVFPYICPVRNCRSLSTTVSTICAHMTGKHWGGMYNDNMDGTISFIDVYRNKGTSSPPIIITQNPLQSGAPPPANPFVNERTRKRTEEQMQLRKDAASALDRSLASIRQMSTQKSISALVESSLRNTAATRAQERGGEFVTDGSLKNEDIYVYLKKILPPSTPIRRKQHVAEYLQYPMLRKLPSWWSITNKNAESSATVASALLYLTGRLAPEGCSACVEAGYSCVLPPVNASAALKQDAKGCGACWGRSMIWHQRNTCLHLTKKGDRSLLTGAARKEASPILGEHPAESRRSTSRLAAESDADSQPEQELESEVETSDGPPSAASTTQADSARKMQRHGLTRSRSAHDEGVGRGSSADVDELEMEDWEVAPGRIRDERAPAAENIAFSNSYLTTNQPISISPDVSFNVVVVKPGCTTQWDAIEGRLRVCSVATGKVKVQMDGAKFQLGPNSMWKIRPGSKCWATNRLYTDAALHVTTITEA
ncbi:conserved hypothetical protein [Verticillium alfalfae VaMs.102]|uniref:Uncharacterized protein n=1 Tax=Verticillium alfalfae (strain VaMs.102 / ATCC MYA-4576 / FGSC 10136) TaxID=526221 RepID=C9SNH4_VERA1|nr:conserved hypothetical protein [Verticillium alfalfae VaMs.102]EEY20339.1 conserved hypothetical protein [Verticillium alfalfae VaMs.102]